jgi:hypothetical protein
MHQSGEEAMLHQDCKRCHNCRLAKDRTGEKYDFKCRLFSAVALSKIKMWLLLYCHLAKDQTGKKYCLKFVYCSVGGR